MTLSVKESFKEGEQNQKWINKGFNGYFNLYMVLKNFVSL